MTMRLFTQALLATALVLPAGTAFAAQSSATASASAAARIIAPITLTKVTDLNFGDVVPGSSAGTVVLTHGGAVSSTGGTTLGNSTNVAAAAFTVGGQANETYAITLPSSATLTSGSSSMTVNAFNSNPSGTGTLTTAGTQPLAVGATLNVGANQSVGSYTGSFSVTAAYN